MVIAVSVNTATLTFNRSLPYKLSGGFVCMVDMKIGHGDIFVNASYTGWMNKISLNIQPRWK